MSQIKIAEKPRIAKFSNTFGVPGLDSTSVHNFTIEDLHHSGQTSLIMIVRKYEESKSRTIDC